MDIRDALAAMLTYAAGSVSLSTRPVWLVELCFLQINRKFD